jgi:hypothetical protein
MTQIQENQPGDIPSELKAFESRLAAMSPLAMRLDRDRTMYLAGAASVVGDGQNASRRRRWQSARLFWPLATAAMTLVSLGLTARLAALDRSMSEIMVMHGEDSSTRVKAGRSPDVVVGEAAKFASSADATSTETESASYLVLRDRVLRLGIDSWDVSAAMSRARASHGDDARNHVLLKEWLGG